MQCRDIVNSEKALEQRSNVETKKNKTKNLPLGKNHHHHPWACPAEGEGPLPSFVGLDSASKLVP